MAGGETLTFAQRRVLSALGRCTVDGWPATVREVMVEAGLASTSTAQYHLHDLARRGLAQQHPRSTHGGWMPTEAGRDSPPIHA